MSGDSYNSAMVNAMTQGGPSLSGNMFIFGGGTSEDEARRACGCHDVPIANVGSFSPSSGGAGSSNAYEMDGI